MVVVGVDWLVGWLVGCLEGYLGAVQELLTISRWWPSARSEGSTRIWCWEKERKERKGERDERSRIGCTCSRVVRASVVFQWLQCSTMANEASQAKDTTRPRTQPGQGHKDACFPKRSTIAQWRLCCSYRPYVWTCLSFE